MVIEPASVRDAQEILDLQKLAYQSEAVLYDDYSIPPLIQSLEQMQADLRTMTVFKATLDGKIVGSVRGSLSKGTCRIGRLIVHPDFQNRGIGKSLMAQIENHFPETRRFELFTGERSQRNLYLYQKLGYCVCHTERLNEKTTVVFLEKPGPAAVAEKSA